MTAECPSRVSIESLSGCPFVTREHCYYNGPSLPMGDVDPHVIHGFFGTIRVLNPNGILIASAIFAGLTGVTDRLTILLGW